MFLLIDNYDSFTFNLVQLFEKLGTSPVVLRNDDKTLFEYLDKENISAVVISPGPGGPLSSGYCLDFLKKLNPNIPVLGVCLGHQILGYFAGYEIVRAKNIMHGKTSLITYKEHELFAGIENPFVATRYHSLVIGGPREKNPMDLDIIATSEDGEIMAIAYKDRPWMGIQFHPESILTVSGPKIIANFLNKIKN